MGVTTTWRINEQVSCLHAAWGATRCGASAHLDNSGEFSRRAHALADEIAANGLSPDVFWPAAIGRATQLESAPDTIFRLLGELSREVDAERKKHGTEMQQQLEADFLTEFPHWRRELELRIGPLRMQWESRAPGILLAAAQMSGVSLTGNIDVIAVSPKLGGFSLVAPQQRVVCLEVLLANVSPQIPETLRLGWLIVRAILRQTPPEHDASLDEVLQLAAIPLVLAAGQHVELCGCNVETIAEALSIWRRDQADTLPLAHLLQSWWGNFQQGPRQPWREALNELRRAAEKNLPIELG